MPRPARDLTGQTFGEWLVLERDPRPGEVRWLCRCSCGTEKAVARTNLLRGQSTSCGHLRARDLTGQTFREWRVLERSRSHKGGAMWLCRCSCGTVREVRARSLRAGGSASCGHPGSTPRVEIDLSEWSVVLVCRRCPWRWLLVGAEAWEIRLTVGAHTARHRAEAHDEEKRAAADRALEQGPKGA